MNKCPVKAILMTQPCRRDREAVSEAITEADIDDLQWRHRLRCSVCCGREIHVRPCWTEPFP